MRERFRKFRQLLGPKNFNLLLAGIAVGICWFLTETAFVYIVQLFFAAIGLIDSSKLGFLGEAPKGMGFACAILLGFAVLRFVVTVSRAFLATWTQQGFIYHIRKQLYASALAGDVSLSTHDVIGLFSEITNNGGFLIWNFSILIVNTCAILFFICAAFWIAPFQTLIGLSIFAVTVFPLKRIVHRIGKLGQETQGEWDKVSYELSTAIKNKFLLKLYGTVDSEVVRGEKTLSTYFAHQKKFGLLLGLLNASPVLIGGFAVVVVTYLSSQYSQISPMNLLAFLYIFMRMAQLGSETNTVLSSVRFYLPALQSLYDWLHRKHPAHESFTYGGVQISKVDSIRFDNVDFAFDRRPILSHLSFEVTPGQCLAIVGQSGSGKSTLLSVMLGLLTSRTGRVLVAGQPIEKLDSSWRDKVAYVGPDPFTISGTLRENLLYGNKRQDLTEVALWDILEVVNLKRELLEIPEGLDYFLKSASRLSSGQLQRLSIARALLRNFDILIFDEGTANLDAATATAILTKVRDITKNKIFIRVTHQGVNPTIEKVIELTPEQRRLELTN